MITETTLNEIAEFAASQVMGEPLIADLRVKYPDYHFTWCFDDDIGATAKPWKEYDTFNLYLVNSSEHCSKLSNDAENASGVVLAEVIADDD
ncbi:DUF6129 family protein [Marinobacterium mangrovicola]|uniref:DUF6129 domain-containing protein n=1 Tax=Marinobacterium mangrovicola TaxID=1476959 RepID=A0A4V2PEA7_9GAMM|nr:DUF6129 family protein [Marinobacterium mangrovicola]TCK08376.1 hypothetical protein CLV83_0455 [Marinobacterium mangrovicola]